MRSAFPIAAVLIALMAGASATCGETGEGSAVRPAPAAVAPEQSDVRPAARPPAKSTVLDRSEVHRTTEPETAGPAPAETPQPAPFSTREAVIDAALAHSCAGVRITRVHPQTVDARESLVIAGCGFGDQPLAALRLSSACSGR